MIGREIDLMTVDSIVERFADGLAGRDLDDWLLACADVNVFEVMGDQWRFSHDRIREQIVDDIEPAKLPAVHRQIAEALESAHGDDADWANVLYFHWSKANNPDRTVHYLDKVVEGLTWYSAKYIEARELILLGWICCRRMDARG